MWSTVAVVGLVVGVWSEASLSACHVCQRATKAIVGHTTQWSVVLAWDRRPCAGDPASAVTSHIGHFGSHPFLDEEVILGSHVSEEVILGSPTATLRAQSFCAYAAAALIFALARAALRFGQGGSRSACL